MNADERTDAELVADAARGNESALAALVRRHIRPATLLAAQLLGDRDDAEDVVQGAFRIVYRDAERFDGTRPFGPWLFAIIRRLAANRLSKHARRARLLRMWSSAGTNDRASPAPDQAVIARLTSEAAWHAMKDLSPMQRACFELVAVRGLSSDEVAAMYAISESTVRQHVFRARAALRARLGDEHSELG